MRLLEELIPILPPDLPVVLDAYAATSLPSLDADCVSRLTGRVVVTPNDHELEFLVGDEGSDESAADDEADDDEGEGTDLPTGIRNAVEKYGAVVACSGWVGSADGFWQVATGDTGLGTSGSGDVLAGAVAGLITRGAPMDQAVVWGVYSHAAAGDRLASEFGRVGYLAGELLAELPLVLASLRGD